MERKNSLINWKTPLAVPDCGRLSASTSWGQQKNGEERGEKGGAGGRNTPGFCPIPQTLTHLNMDNLHVNIAHWVRECEVHISTLYQPDGCSCSALSVFASVHVRDYTSGDYNSE